ncbi:uncharacterized protein LOC105157032 [Sesamum indicum]|uniref:Uncharacterized protein LOC105157032 n=1 Tax=Sesamum indicum TaxID=4182 RepID=A0A6I9SNS4_SESIN|nr:uncharacterized protein LOC105157032 [Sesamum indicum]XP_011071629.1 uncharacterized protein LOC105157032 [Sesamum indicum]XP_011071631.1 uncharacterized protein LOC105157032 [Sesamum indicum]XP_020548019.1 uncharacterized protein LOC105157032 [Sesamum indicum]
MSTLQSSPGDRDTVQAINALKKGSYLLKYGRWGKPKFCPFRLSNDEKTLIWYVGEEQKQLQLSQVSRIIPGQRTAVFQRYPQPEKEYQSFSLIYGKNSLDVICKDKYEAEIWFVALRALISRGNSQRWRTEIRTEGILSDCSSDQIERNSQSVLSNSSSDAVHEDRHSYNFIDVLSEKLPQKKLRKAFSDVVLHKAASLCSPLRDSVLISGILQQNEDVSGRNSADSFRHSFSSAISTSSPESSPGDGPLSNIFMWGEGIDDVLLDGGTSKYGESFPRKDVFLPKILESASALDAQNIAFGSRHAVLITRQGQVFSWGDGSGGKLGHGLEADISNPKLIDGLGGLDIVSIGCGEYHTCAVTLNGDLYTWGDGIHNFGLLGHGTEFSYFTPRKVMGQMEGICVTSISCGPWHSAAITSLGQLFTFGDGTFGALGHGNRCCTNVPREVEALKGQKVVRVSCGFWHTAAVVEDHSELPSCSDSLSGKLFSWGNGDEGQLGHGDTLCQLVPCRIKMPNDRNFCQVACGQSITVALTICGQVYTMGTTDCGEVRLPGKGHTLPMRIEGKIRNSFIKEISCGSHHVVAVTSKSEVFTWGKGRNGQLGHGDNADRNSPTPVKALEGKQVKRIACGNNFTAAICLHQWACAADYSFCAGCRGPFNFKRTRHNCYNCGLVFCKACTNKKSLNASLAPNLKKSYRVCEDCFSKLNKGLDSRVNVRPPRSRSLCIREDSSKEKKKDFFKVKQRSILSRLSSFDSFRRSTKKLCKKNQRPNSNSTPTSPLDGVNFGSDISFASSPSTSMIDNCDKINASLPGSKMHSPSSPFSSVTSTPHYMLLLSLVHGAPSHEEVIDDSKQTNDDLTEEISILREQVEVLTRKSEFLAAELERTSDQLVEATAWVQAESQKNNSAKEAIKCQMSQLKEMAAKLPQGAFYRASGSFPDMCHVLGTGST